MKYKVGDKVKTIGTFGKGKHSVGTIVETDNSNTEYKVHFDDSDLYLWFFEHEFKTVEQLPFPIGTKVRYVSGFDEFSTGIFKGQSEKVDDCWAIERHDGLTGGAQNGWWNFNKDGVMEEVKDTTQSLCGINESALEPAEQLGEYKPFNHLINNKFMSIKNKIKMLMTGEPEKTLIKHGILTIDKELTCDGKQLFNEFIENKFKEEFLKGLYEVLKDEKLED